LLVKFIEVALVRKISPSLQSGVWDGSFPERGFFSRGLEAGGTRDGLTNATRIPT
jgi:hypothetical protein